MGKISCLIGLSGLALVTGVSGETAAQTAGGQHWPPPSVSYYGDPKFPDISGLWLGTVMAVPGRPAANNSGRTADGRPPLYLEPWPLPYTPAYQKIADERAAAAKQGRALGDIGARCLPFGLPLMLLSKNYPDEIVQTPGAVTFFMYNTFPIVIWTDGRRHPDNLKLSYNGHSIGHWVGDTLFVDTIGINGSTPIDGLRDPHSEQLHINWTVQRVAPDRLHVRMTFYDNKAFTEPVTATNIWARKTDSKWQILDDASCFENATGISQKEPEPGFTRF